MQKDEFPYNERQQCPVCYEQEMILREVCQNSHRICEKCMFNLRKRQCPICKNHFRIDWRVQENGLKYGIIFGKEDQEHNEIAIDEDAFEENETIRNYERYLQEYEDYRQRAYQHELYHHHYHQIYSHPYPSLYVHQIIPTRHHYHQSSPFSNPAIHQNPQHIRSPNTQIIQQIYQNQPNIRNPEYRRSVNEQIRMKRRTRDEIMYLQNVGRQLKIEIGSQQQNSNQIADKGCGLFDQLGRFIISIGQKLTNKKGQSSSQEIGQISQHQGNKDQFQTTNYEQQNNQFLNIQQENPFSNSHHHPPFNSLHHYYHPNLHFAPNNHQIIGGYPHHYHYGLNHNPHYHYHYHYPYPNQYQQLYSYHYQHH